MRIQMLRRGFILLALMAAGPVAGDTYVLVHGAFQSARTWGAVQAELEAAGHEVVAVDLPGRNAEGEAAKAVTLQAYIETVGAVVEAADAPVHLVAHSFGGMTISAVAEAQPAEIATLVYVAAYLPVDGESMESLAYSDTDNGFTEQSFVIAGDYSHATILAEDQARLFANDGTAEQQAAVEASMIREPLGPIGTVVKLSEANFGSVPKAYIRTLRDQTVSTPLQTRMIERAGVARVRDLDTGHAPYVTAPGPLAAAILDLTLER